MPGHPSGVPPLRGSPSPGYVGPHAARLPGRAQRASRPHHSCLILVSGGRPTSPEQQQEQEQKESIAKLLKLVGWKVLALTSILSITISVVATIFIINQTSSKKLQNFIKDRTIEDKNGQNYLKFQANELIYDQQKKIYYYKIN